MRLSAIAKRRAAKTRARPRARQRAQHQRVHHARSRIVVCRCTSAWSIHQLRGWWVDQSLCLAECNRSRVGDAAKRRAFLTTLIEPGASPRPFSSSSELSRAQPPRHFDGGNRITSIMRFADEVHVQVHHRPPTHFPCYERCKGGLPRHAPLDAANRRHVRRRACRRLVAEWEALSTQEACEMAQHLNESTSHDHRREALRLFRRVPHRARPAEYDCRRLDESSRSPFATASATASCSPSSCGKGHRPGPHLHPRQKAQSFLDARHRHLSRPVIRGPHPIAPRTLSGRLRRRGSRADRDKSSMQHPRLAPDAPRRRTLRRGRRRSTTTTSRPPRGRARPLSHAPRSGSGTARTSESSERGQGESPILAPPTVRDVGPGRRTGGKSAERVGGSWRSARWRRWVINSRDKWFGGCVCVMDVRGRGGEPRRPRRLRRALTEDRRRRSPRAAARADALSALVWIGYPEAAGRAVALAEGTASVVNAAVVRVARAFAHGHATRRVVVLPTHMGTRAMWIAALASGTTETTGTTGSGAASSCSRTTSSSHPTRDAGATGASRSSPCIRACGAVHGAQTLVASRMTADATHAEAADAVHTYPLVGSHGFLFIDERRPPFSITSPRVEAAMRVPRWRSRRVGTTSSSRAGTGRTHVDAAVIAYAYWNNLTVLTPAGHTSLCDTRARDHGVDRELVQCRARPLRDDAHALRTAQCDGVGAHVVGRQLRRALRRRHAGMTIE